MTFKIGLIINPIAGIGGRVGLKGSDGVDIQAKAIAMGAKPLAHKRVADCLTAMSEIGADISWYTVSGKMGAEALALAGWDYETIYSSEQDETTEQDTIEAARIMQQRSVDLLLFAGGDGTARNVMSGLDSEQLCLGIPAGCKIYSGVFAVTPEAAAEVIKDILSGSLYQFTSATVLDLDEESYRAGKVTTRLYGDMRIPETAKYVQNVKVAGRESEDLVKEDVAAWIVETMDEDTLYLIGSGSICMAIKEYLAIDGTLLGVDAVLSGELVAKDATEAELMVQIHSHDGPVRLIITPIGGQGILLGRGNHTICHQVIEHLGMTNTTVVSSKAKLNGLEGRPLLVDTGKKALNHSLSGYIPVITGYDDQVLYLLQAL